MEKSLIHGPVVVLGESEDIFHWDGMHGGVELVLTDSLEKIFDSTFDFKVLASKLLGSGLNPVFLHVDELGQGEGRASSGQVNQDSLRKGLKIVLDTVLHDIVDVNDQLVQLGKTLVNMLEETFNIHRGPSKTADTRSETSLEIINVRSEKTASVRTNLVDDSNTFSDDVLELVVVVLELGFLEEHKFGRLRDLNANTSKTFGFTDQSENLSVEVDIELQVLVVSDEKGGLEAGLGTVDFFLPFFSPHILV